MKHAFIATCMLISLTAMSQDERYIHTDWGNTDRYSVANSQIGPRARKEKRVVFIGDSITEGWLGTDPAFFADKPYLNRGIGGQTTPQMLLRFRADVIDLKPKVVVILAGINDIAENTGVITIEAILGNIISMVQLAHANDIRVVVSSVLPANTFPWRPEIQPADKVIALNNLLRSYCKENKVVYLDYYTKMVDTEKGLDQRYTYDGVHTTLDGYLLMGPLVESSIQQAIKEKRRVRRRR
jgi:lysophospholipase L1-like esterase